MASAFSLDNWFGPSKRSLGLETQGEGPRGQLPLTDEMLRTWSSGDLFGWTQNAGMGWDIQKMMGPQFLLLSTQGGIRGEDGQPIALGYHTGHWEVGLMMRAAADWLSNQGGVPFAGFVSDPCDGRTQGTVGMFDSLPYRNDAAIVFRRLIRSLPTRRGVLGIATCDKGLPAMMLALAGISNLPSVVVPGGVTLPAREAEDLGKVQTIGARYTNGLITLEEAAEAGAEAGDTDILPSVSMRAINCSAMTVPPSATKISDNTPAAGAGTSKTTLSVSISIKISSADTVSPAFFFHCNIVASATDSDNCGTFTSTIDMCFSYDGFLKRALRRGSRLISFRQDKAFELGKSRIHQSPLLVLMQV